MPTWAPNWTVMMIGSLGLLAVIGLVCTVFVTPYVIRIAWRLKITDSPDGNRKLHGRPIPLGGGVSVFIGCCCATVFGMFIRGPSNLYLRGDLGGLEALFAAGLTIVIIGLIDDKVNLRGWQKLIGQIIAASVLVASGLIIRHVSLFDQDIDLGWVAVPCTLFWLVGAMNSLNLLDGIDGLATTVGLILSLTIAALAMLAQHYMEAMVIAALAGALCGFLRFNLPPAKMFLGDAGSMFIGLMVGALAIRSALKGPATIALAAPFAVWTIPIFDSTAAILRRKLTGRSIYTTDRGHLHHRLLAQSGSTSRTLGWIGLCCGVTSLGAIISLWSKNDLLAVVISFCVVGVLVATRVFGHVELMLLRETSHKVGRTLLRLIGAGKFTGQETSIRLQGTRPWDQLWNSLIEFTDKFNLHTIRLDVNIPAFHEGYHASWASPVRCDSSKLWRTEIPLFADEQMLGRLTITGQRDETSVCEVIDRLMDFLFPFEARLREIVAERTGALPPSTSTIVPSPPVPQEAVVGAPMATWQISKGSDESLMG